MSCAEYYKEARFPNRRNYKGKQRKYGLCYFGVRRCCKRKEKQELKHEYGELKEQNKNLLQSLTDARSKVLQLQNEKSSLLTALRLRLHSSGEKKGGQNSTAFILVGLKSGTVS